MEKDVVEVVSSPTDDDSGAIASKDSPDQVKKVAFVQQAISPLSGLTSVATIKTAPPFFAYSPDSTACTPLPLYVSFSMFFSRFFITFSSQYSVCQCGRTSGFNWRPY